MNQARRVVDMNERIKDAWEKAAQPHSGDSWADQTAFLEKFAELIVQECMDCSTWVGKVNKNVVEPMHTAQAINQRIRKHFGIEKEEELLKSVVQ